MFSTIDIKIKTFRDKVALKTLVCLYSYKKTLHSENRMKGLNYIKLIN